MYGLYRKNVIIIVLYKLSNQKQKKMDGLYRKNDIIIIRTV